LQGVLRIFVFLVVVFCGEDVVICVAGVVFWQSLFEGQKMRHYFVKFWWGGAGRVCSLGLSCIFSFMPDRKRKPERTTPHKDKICKTCGRTFEWSKKWERYWDVIKYCSDDCRGHKAGESDAALEAAILELLVERGRDKTICPSEAAKVIGGVESRRDWEGLMEPSRAAARRLVAAGKVVITQHGHVVDPSTAKGPIRLRLR
jgi:hypothetical protein